MKVVQRILAFPFVFGVILIGYNVSVVHRSLLFLKYGGEWINYDKKMNRKTIQDHYNETFK